MTLPAGLFRRLCLYALSAMMLCAAMIFTAPAKAQMGFDRPGGDYTNSPVLSRDPAECALQCERDRRCKAWSFVFPRDLQITAVCWLKNTLPARVADSCCISGVRGAGVVEQSAGPVEMFIDRFGGDYRDFRIQGNDSEQACESACKDDTRCRAWTFARPGYVGRDARCFLKGEIKPPRRAPGLISGVVR